MQYLFVYATAANMDEARKIARAAVGQKLAACVNIIPQIESVYRWDGAVQESAETAMIFKTTDARLAALEQCVRENHSYDCPAFVAVPIAGGHEPYLKWVGESVG